MISITSITNATFTRILRFFLFFPFFFLLLLLLLSAYEIWGKTILVETVVPLKRYDFRGQVA